MPARRILVTGVANALGVRLARELAGDPEVERVIGVDTREPPDAVRDRITFIRSDVRAPELGALLAQAAVDTIVHNDIVQFPEPERESRHLHDINVIGTLQLLAAAENLPRLERVVVRGSAAIYGSEAGAPAFFTEDMARRGWGTGSSTRFQRDVAELEAMFDTFARRHPDVRCTMLRLQPIVGTSLGSPINALFRAPVVFTALGFDPRIQVLHEDDAVAALAAAARAGVRGPVNVAGEGVVSLSRVMRRLGRRALPVAVPLLPTVSGAMARVTGGRPLSDDIIRYLRHGRAVDTTRMREELGFRPRYSTEEAIVAVAEALRSGRAAA